MKPIRHLDLLLALIIVIAFAILSIATYSRMMGMSFFVGPLRVSHWLSIIGTLYIGIATPLFVVLKRSYPTKWPKLMRFHMFGNLFFFGLIAIHFSAQLGRSASNFPELGTGLAMTIAMTLEVALGFTQRFRSQNPTFNRLLNLKSNRFLHAGLFMVFYFAIVIHVLHGFGVGLF
jgi:hypothetical protein